MPDPKMKAGNSDLVKMLHVIRTRGRVAEFALTDEEAAQRIADYADGVARAEIARYRDAAVARERARCQGAIMGTSCGTHWSTP